MKTSMENPAKHTKRPLRFALQFAGLQLVNIVYVPIVLLFTFLSWGRWARPLINGYGRIMLLVARAELVVEPAAAAELRKRRRRIITFNHCSTMDMFLMTALWPEGGVAVVKRELYRLPIMGQAMMLLDFIPLDRENRAKAMAALDAASKRVREKDLSVIMAPEGTRSKTGELQSFKLGAFHMAAQADAPIVPLVLHGTRQLWPRWQAHSSTGRVTVRLLAELDSGADAADGESIRARAERLHAMYAAELERMDREVPVFRG
jgi:1-acyl-sn-glycerol-3-phosphate acyltransferase